MIVDDDRLLAETLRAMIAEHADADVQVMTNGSQAAAHLDAEPELHAVLCDLSMPGVDGIALYERLRTRGSPLADRFILITGGAFTAASSAFLARTALPCLQKPFDVAQLGAVLGPLLTAPPDAAD